MPAGIYDLFGEGKYCETTRLRIDRIHRGEEDTAGAYNPKNKQEESTAGQGDGGQRCLSLYR